MPKRERVSKYPVCIYASYSIPPRRAGELMQDLKTGHLCGASPRAQFFGQLIGSSLSIVVTTTAYTLYNRAYVIPGPSFPAPAAYVWLSLARLLRMNAFL